MKLKEKKLAIGLRKKGWSLKQIASHLRVSRGSVSYWIRNISLSPRAIARLEQRKIIGYEKQRLSRIKNSARKLEELQRLCFKMVGEVSRRDLFVAGLMLYASEGTKRKNPQGQYVEFTNADPATVRVFVAFLTDCCGVMGNSIRYRLFIYEDINEGVAKKAWQKFLNIPHAQFLRSHIKPIHNAALKRRSLYGTMHVVVYSKKLFQKIMAWIQAFIRGVA